MAPKQVKFDSERERFVVGRPFAENVQTGENKALALARLHVLNERLNKLGIREDYAKEFEGLMKMGFAEAVDEKEQVEGPISHLTQGGPKSGKLDYEVAYRF